MAQYFEINELGFVDSDESAITAKMLKAGHDPNRTFRISDDDLKDILAAIRKHSRWLREGYTFVWRVDLDKRLAECFIKD